MQLFNFQELSNSSVRVGVARARLTGDWLNRKLGPGVQAALAAGKHTDVLLLKLNQIPAGLDLSSVGPNAVFARGAFLSFGSIVRKAACSFSDVQPSEVRIGVRATPRLNDSPTFELYMLDTLENGAGYCRHLDDEDRIVEHVLRPLANGESVAKQLCAESHRSLCDASCTDCLREYGNSEMHPLLDWRLALDLVDLALDGNADIGLHSPRWSTLAAQIGDQFAKQVNGSFRCRDDGRFQLTVGKKGYDLIHPIEAASSRNSINMFDLVRRPGQIVSRLGSR